MDAVIGHTGFVGGTLCRQHDFGARFNSSTIDAAAGRDFDVLVCAAAPGSMFEANRFPDRDAARMQALMDKVSAIRARRFVLISSIAVLADFAGGDDETTTAFQDDLAYGRNRRALEAFCADRFDDCLIVRLPALFGPGLRKNFVFDLLNPVPSMLRDDAMATLLSDLPGAETATLRAVYGWDDGMQMHKLDRAALDTDPAARAALEDAVVGAGRSATQFHHPDTTYQYYDMARLWSDIGTAQAAGLGVIHLAPEPLRAADIHAHLTGRAMPQTGARLHAEDMRTAHAGLWGRTGPYLDDADAVLARLKAFFDTERARAGAAA